MTLHRVHVDLPLQCGESLTLPPAAFRHLIQVLRLKTGAAVTVFNGRGGEYRARIGQVSKRQAWIEVVEFVDVSRESPLDLRLVQAVSKGERMDWTVQKAAEIGATQVVPVLSQFCNVSMNAARWEKKRTHWQAVMTAACEQCGRTRIPALGPIQTLSDWLDSPAAGTRLILDPDQGQPIANFAGATAPIDLLIGPEGGFSESEIRTAINAGCKAARMGPRLFRTETAGLAAMAVLQALAGDLN